MSTLRSSWRYLSPRNSILGENHEAREGFGKEKLVRLRRDADGYAG